MQLQRWEASTCQSGGKRVGYPARFSVLWVSAYSHCTARLGLPVEDASISIMGFHSSGMVDKTRAMLPSNFPRLIMQLSNQSFHSPSQRPVQFSRFNIRNSPHLQVLLPTWLPIQETFSNLTITPSNTVLWT